MNPNLSALGIVCALGDDKQSVLNNCLAGSQEGMQERDDLRPGAPCFVGQVQGELPPLSEFDVKHQNRCNQIAMKAYLQIADDVAALPYNRDRIAVIIGTSTSGILAGERAMAAYQQTGSWPADYDYATQEMGCPAEFIAKVSGAKGPVQSISTACSSSAKALISAYNFIKAGIVDAAIVGGVDSLCKLTVSGFSALESVSSGLCSPFSANRDGINIGEGAALFVMRKDQQGIMLSGFGESTDGYHISAPEPSGQGAMAAMSSAIRMAGIAAEQVSYLNLHGTGTIKNDEMEALATHTLLTKTPCSSTKPLTGHTLGAAGAIEAAICWLLMSEFNPEGHLPFNQIGDLALDSGLPEINLLRSRSKQQGLITHCLSNSFAFGGSNVSLLLSRES